LKRGSWSTNCLPFDRMYSRLHLCHPLEHLACKSRKESIYGCKVVISATSSDGSRGNLWVGSEPHHPDVWRVGTIDFVRCAAGIHGRAAMSRRKLADLGRWMQLFSVSLRVRDTAVVCNREYVGIYFSNGLGQWMRLRRHHFRLKLRHKYNF
jgi:hypothetical protein